MTFCNFLFRKRYRNADTSQMNYRECFKNPRIDQTNYLYNFITTVQSNNVATL